MNKVLKVSELNSKVKLILDSNKELNSVFVEGEISNLKIHYKSGHIYFSLKDDKAVVKSVMFASYARRMRFVPKDGMKVLVKCQATIYENSGEYQLYIYDMQPDGLGALNLAYEQLWEKLNKEGLFSEILKKDLPIYPNNIAVVTSPKGDAVKDIISILGRRWSMAKIRLYSCSVQGEKAVPELIQALNQADNDENEIIIIGRGGGSLEDLWAFNNEELARNIYKAKTPVISAVGHENDFTICDYVADVRASTPSAAAELAVPNMDEEKQNILAVRSRLDLMIKTKIQNYELKLDSLGNPRLIIDNKMQKEAEKMDYVSSKFKLQSKIYVDEYKHSLEVQITKLDNLSPLKVMARGYSVLQKDGENVNSVENLKINDEVTAVMTDGQIKLKVLTEV